MSESSPSLAEMTAPKAAPSVTSAERTNGRTNFSPLPPRLSGSPQEENYKAVAEEALRNTQRDMDLALAKAGAKPTATESLPPPKSAPPEMPEMPQLTSSQLAEARAELKTAKESGQGTPTEHAEVEQLLSNMEKQLSLPGKAPVKMAPSVEKRVSSNVAAVKPETVAKASTESKEESGSKSSLLSKINHIAEKIFSIPASIWRFLTAWIMK